MAHPRSFPDGALREDTACQAPLPPSAACVIREREAWLGTWQRHQGGELAVGVGPGHSGDPMVVTLWLGDSIGAR